ncbi:cytochrome c oxidase subunit 4 [Propioniciclava soli]|uniref:Cytochrome c oxidase polypeptide 4 n=1 Tax=Propioniciclava soli TaxID=2775081 RepID=A0ABZ3C4Q9_9ACTN|nr:cytochrome c oxidase subunit 4 [Propioniciclava soli]
MRTEARVFLFLVIFFGVVTPAYAGVTWWLDGALEPIGTTVLALTLLFSAMIWGTFAITGRTLTRGNQPGRPEDRKDAEIIDGVGALGFFPPKSLVPFWSAIAIMLLLLGPVFGWWISLIGVAVGIWTVFGWAYEFYVGDYRH